jgi:hypothetical protein
MRRVLVIATAAVLMSPDFAVGRAPGPDWTLYADCAGAYLANARLADPDRPAAMTAQISDVAKDYVAAALTRYRARHAAAGARRAVQARVDAKAAGFAAQPRDVVERVIDACPQVGG